MTVRDSRAEYEQRMHRVLAHVDRHLERGIELAELAEVSHFSPYHFHRLFSAWMGETVGDYLRRRRVEVAAMRLAAQPRLPVLQAALAVGFGSPEAFARAFKLHFGASPTEWRKAQAEQRNRNPDQAKRNPGQASREAMRNHGISNAKPKEIPMNVTVIDRKPVTVAYLRRTGPYGEGISDFWQQTVYPWMVTNNLLGHVRYGISLDDPEITAPAKCRYDACVEVASDFVAVGKSQMTTLPGGKYAALAWTGRADEIEAAWLALLRDWLPSSGLQLDARPHFEHYPLDSTWDPETGAFSCEICIPVAPL